MTRYPPRRRPAFTAPRPLPMAESELAASIRKEAIAWGWDHTTGGFSYHATIPWFDRRGWPDYVLMRWDDQWSGTVQVRRLFVELKTDAGRLTVEQCLALDMLSAGIPPATATADEVRRGQWTPPPLEVYAWRPELIEEAYHILRGAPPPPTGWATAWQLCGPEERRRAGLTEAGRLAARPRQRRQKTKGGRT